MNILIKNGRVIDPASGTDRVTDIYAENGFITEPPRNSGGAELVIDASGFWVTPGFIDIHVHLRDPGYTHKEDIASGCAAAAAGGFTGVLAMPNTHPPADNPDTINYVLEKGKKTAAADVYPCGCVTKKMEGRELADISSLAKAGAKAISEDGKSVLNTRVIYDALLLCKENGIPMLSHCEDKFLAKGAMNKGVRSLALGISGQDALAESLYVARDIMLARQTGAHVHICHVSTEESVSLIREAKKNGVHVTAEAAPHHFILTENAIDGTNANFKMNPPLRSAADVEAITKALADGTIDCIATDHAPHAEWEKIGFENAAFGIIGLETALPLCITHLVNKNILTPTELIRKLTANPASIININAGTLKYGANADITIIDPKTEYITDPSSFKSKARNTPFNGCKVAGRVMYTIYKGFVTYKFNN